MTSIYLGITNRADTNIRNTRHDGPQIQTCAQKKGNRHSHVPISVGNQHCANSPYHTPSIPCSKRGRPEQRCLHTESRHSPPSSCQRKLHYHAHYPLTTTPSSNRPSSGKPKTIRHGIDNGPDSECDDACCQCPYHDGNSSEHCSAASSCNSHSPCRRHSLCSSSSSSTSACGYAHGPRHHNHSHNQPRVRHPVPIHRHQERRKNSGWAWGPPLPSLMVASGRSQECVCGKC